MARKINYLNNKDILKEIAKSKLAYCSFVSKEVTIYDAIVPNVSAITKKSVAEARATRATRLAKEAQEAELALGNKRKLDEFAIPVENIQDLSFVGGPILRYFGLTLIKIETAGGGGGPHHQNMMSMLGIKDAESFKTQILAQREKVINQKHGYGNNMASEAKQSQVIDNTQLLTDIKNELIEIKNALKNKAD